MSIENVTIPLSGATIAGILAAPQGRGPFPGVVVIPTIKALDEFAAYIVERLAAEGFVALGVNIFDHPGVPEDPFKRPGSQPDEQVLADLDGAFAVLRKHPLVKDQPIFAWGYCLGGRFALLWPTYRREVAGAASFHGFPTNDTANPNTPTEPAGRVEHLLVPVIACFGEVDRLVPMKEVSRYRAEVERHRKDVEIHTYPGADHGWTNPKGPTYNKDAAEDSWRRAVECLRRSTAAKPKVASA